MNVQKNSRLISALLSAAGAVIGLFLITNPKISAFTICYILGAVIALIGIWKITAYFLRKESYSFFNTELIMGIIFLILGLILILHPGNVIALLPVMTGVFIIIDAIIKLQTAIDIKRAGVTHWWVILTLAVLSAALGILLIYNPFAGAYTVIVFIGISMLFNSIQNIVSLIYISKYIRDNYIKETVYIKK